MTTGQPAKGYWAAIPERIQELIAASFHNLPFAVPTNWPIGRSISTNGRWVPAPLGPGKRGFGEGSEGLVNLWCLLDENNVVGDRIIIKQIHVGATRYNDPSNWTDGTVGGEPRECAMANAVCGALPESHAEHVLECLGWGDCRGEPRWRYRLYFEYCNYGDLTTIVEAQRRDTVAPGSKRKADDDGDGDVLLPEPFIWYLLESLAKATVGLDKADILHGDMQMRNVFFGSPDPKRFGIYPTPKVADFGSSRRLADPGVRNRSDLVRRDACCALFAPPELSKINDGMDWEVSEPGTTLSNKTNVWQIGMLIACCMRLCTYLPEMNWRGMRRADWEVAEKEQLRFRTTSRGKHELERDKLVHENSKYSEELVEIIFDCLKFNPVERPKAEELLRRIQECMQGPVAGVLDYLPGKDRVDDDIQRHKLRTISDGKYRIGKTF
ncbi:hypothetical protein AUEXF2481DRAFT_6379 [Aureobasidium subglaciale EXF-2481]|uniref:Protein kinase domain-containing protein n=1 Tax=Aureobasidium subglaciale (strain EXF-2481) TaxID=1043005 RepID=A0A074Y7N6_AURSE|nr:uncharacterized protein AUEXF2481DRAFT_6379 [Aureobasidium subglaciale EXF-2481]KEQ93798.1 hypothetical protein AUEXF2481DRAFT_6379 [Aureobasidium subglaciale EXF-2481]